MDIKKTILTALVLAAMVFFGIAAPNTDTSSYAPDNQKNWTSKAKNPNNPDSIYEYTEHADLPASGVSYSGYDETKLNIILSELKRYAKAQPASGDSPYDGAVYDAETALPLLVEALLDETDKLYTQQQLLDIEYYRDANNEVISDESSEVAEKINDATDRSLQTLRDVLKGPNRSIIKKELTKEQVDYLAEYEDMTKKQKRLAKEDNALVQEYDKLILNSADLKKDNKEFTRIFKELVEIRNEEAATYGYDNFPDYAYEFYYGRDYDSEDAQDLYADVKKYIVPVFLESVNKFYSTDFYQILEYYDSGDEILRNIAPYIGDIDPELNSSFNYLRRHHLYDLDATATKMDVGYTTDLPQYGALYIFNSPYGEASDYSVTIHEFGHYNAGFHQSGRFLFEEPESYDILEIQSQGLEMLFLDYYDELFGDSADIIRLETLTNMLSGVVSGCMYDEFQQVIYRNPDMTAKEIDKLAGKLAKEYGLIDAQFTTKEDALYDWVNVSHTYESPMYYISYATSALSSLDIWVESLDDREAAIDKYMEVSAIDPTLPYLGALKKCGLTNIFDDGAVKDIAKRIHDVL